MIGTMSERACVPLPLRRMDEYVLKCLSPAQGFLNSILEATDVACNKEYLLITEEIIYLLIKYICRIKLMGKRIVMLYHKEKCHIHTCSNYTERKM